MINEMETLELGGWDEFGGVIRDIQTRRRDISAKTGRRMEEPLFRGLGDSQWTLETTLERAFPLELNQKCGTLVSYYQLANRARTSIENLLEHDFGTLPTFPDFLTSIKAGPLEIFFSYNPDVYRYLAHLRHHGYPSPLLDWSASPYIAAFFAFDAMPDPAKNVAVQVIVRDTVKGHIIGEPEVVVLGPYVRTHRRHTVQQSQYTLCVAETASWDLHKHDEAMGQVGSLGSKGFAVRIVIPAVERSRALRELDSMNINGYSLFGSQESLIKTIARRENLLRT